MNLDNSDMDSNDMDNTPFNSPNKKRGVPKRYTDEELKMRRKESQRKYMLSEKGRLSYRKSFDRYRKTDKYKESLKRIYDKKKGMAYSSEEDTKDLPELIDYDDICNCEDDYE